MNQYLITDARAGFEIEAVAKIVQLPIIEPAMAKNRQYGQSILRFR
ncbi:MAG: hypothetical protein ACPGF7_09710 [Pontibacterium sp.]